MSDQKQRSSVDFFQAFQQNLMVVFNLNHSHISGDKNDNVSKLLADLHLLVHGIIIIMRFVFLLFSLWITKYVYEYFYLFSCLIPMPSLFEDSLKDLKSETRVAIWSHLISILMMYLLFYIIIKFQFNLVQEKQMEKKLSTEIKLPISEEKLKELRLKLKKQKEEKPKEELYQPPILTEEDIKKHKFSPAFVESHEYLCQHYKELSKKYGDKTWLIIEKSGVTEHSEDFDTIYNIFYDKGYSGKAILSQVGKKGCEYRLVKTSSIDSTKLHCPMVLCNEKTFDCDLQDFLFDTGSETTTILKKDLENLNLKEEGIRNFRLANGIQIKNPITLSFSFDEYPDKSFRRQVCVDEEVRLLGMDIILENKFIVDGINKEFIY